MKNASSLEEAQSSLEEDIVSGRLIIKKYPMVV
jgi:hypothetical protein